MSRSICKVHGCSNSKSRKPELSFFRFPKDKPRLDAWLKSIGIVEAKAHDVVCSSHFEQKFILKYAGKQGRIVLSDVAVPTLLLPRATTEQEENIVPSTSFTSESLNDTIDTSSSADLSTSIDQTNELSEMDLDVSTSIAPPISASTPIVPTSPITRCSAVQAKDCIRKQKAQLLKTIKAIKKKNYRLRMANKKKATTLNTMRTETLTWQRTVEEVESHVSPQFHQLFLSEANNFGKSNKGKRWTFQQKMLAMAMRCRGPRLYNYMRRFLSLPTHKSIKNIFNSVDLVPGINSSIKKTVAKKVAKMAEANKLVVLIADEVSLQKGVTYCKRKDAMVGFQDLGHLGKKTKVATHAFTFMVKSIYSNYKFPIAHYATGDDLTGEDIAKLTQKVISELQTTGLKVKGIIWDGPPKNRRASNILGATTEQPYFFINGEKIYVFIDPPHLLKAVRNSLLTHNFHLDDHVIKWEYIKKFAELDATLPAKIAPKLTSSHLEPKDSRQKMCVKRAAQVLSSNTAAGLYTHATFGHLPHEATFTADVVLNFDRLMDSFNGTTVSDPKNPPAKEYRVALTDSSPHLGLWADIKTMLKGFTFSRSKNGKKIESLPFVNGWIQTITASEMLWADLKAEGHTYLPMRSINQDPLENLFSSIRYNGGNNRNPTVAEFVPALTQCIVSLLSTPTKGNCEEDDNEMLIDLHELFAESPEDEEVDSSDPENLPNEYCPAAEDTPNQGHTSGPNDNNDLNDLSSQGMANIAGALVRKVLRKTGNCQDCKNVLTTTEYLPAHFQLTFRDGQKHLSYASEAVCQLVTAIKNLGRSLFPALFYETDVLKKFQSKSRQAADLDALNLCPVHVESAKETILTYICNVSFYDEVKRFNSTLRENDVLSRMVRNRIRQNRKPPSATRNKGGTSAEDVSDVCAELIADFCEEITKFSEEMEEGYEEEVFEDKISEEENYDYEV